MAPRGGAIKKRPACARETEEEPEEELVGYEADTPDPPTPAAKRGRGKGRGRGSPSSTDRQGSPPSGSTAKGDNPKNGSNEESPATAARRAMRWASPTKPQQPQQPDRLRVAFRSAEVACAPPLGGGLVALRDSGSLCDAVIVGGDGHRRPVHRVVLAANSSTFLDRLEGDTLSLPTFTSAAIDMFVEWLYGTVSTKDYEPTYQINAEMLKLGSEFVIPPLVNLAQRHLALSATVDNVVDSIRLCEEFNLAELRQALVQGIKEDGEVMKSVAKGAGALSHPLLMRELLQCIAAQANGGN